MKNVKVTHWLLKQHMRSAVMFNHTSNSGYYQDAQKWLDMYKNSYDLINEQNPEKSYCGMLLYRRRMSRIGGWLIFRMLKYELKSFKEEVAHVYGPYRDSDGTYRVVLLLRMTAEEARADQRLYTAVAPYFVIGSIGPVQDMLTQEQIAECPEVASLLPRV